MPSKKNAAKNSVDTIKSLYGKLTPIQRNNLEAISLGFGLMMSNAYWTEDVALEDLGLVKLKKAKNFRFHNTKITNLGQDVINYGIGMDDE